MDNEFPTQYYYIPRSFSEFCCHRSSNNLFNKAFEDNWIYSREDLWLYGVSYADKFALYLMGGEL